MRLKWTSLACCTVFGVVVSIFLYLHAAPPSVHVTVHQSRVVGTVTKPDALEGHAQGIGKGAQLETGHERATHPSSVPQDSSEVTHGSSAPNAFIHAMQRLASKDGEILLSLVDTGFTPMVINFFLTSLQPLGIRNYLILTMDPDTCVHLQRYRINCLQYTNMSHGAAAVSPYGSQDFLAKMNIRTDMILEALGAGFRVLHSDVDMLFFKDPFEAKPCPPSECDMAILYDRIQYNAGFLFINPTNVSTRIYRSMKDFALKHPKVDDQTQLNNMVKQEMKANHNANIIKLSTQQFQCGFYYYEEPKRYFGPPSPCPECVVVHNNWIVSMEAKVYRARELHQWLYNAGEYYTDSRRKYLVYQNKIPTAKPAIEVEALQAALQISSILNRTLVLPRFHLQQVEVPFNALFRVSNFDKQFEYRESSFLTNPMVPDAVKQSVFGPVLIMSSSASRYFPHLHNDTTIRRFEPKSLELGMTEAEILAAFGEVTQSVLMFHSMCGAFAGFTHKQKASLWRTKLSEGIMPAVYRQYFGKP